MDTNKHEYSDDNLCRLMEAIGFFHFPEERAFKERYACLKSKFRKLKKIYPGQWIEPPVRGITMGGCEFLREPEQWKQFSR